MDFQLVPATLDNVDGIAHCAYRAFFDDALENSMFPLEIAPPGTNPRVEVRQRRLRAILPLPEWHYILATVPSAHDASPQIVGFAGWQAPPTGESKRDQPSFADLVFPGVDAEAFQYATEANERAKKETLGAEVTNVWYLASLGVDPDFRGKGIGSKLVQWGLDQADRAGKAAYLEASPAAVGLYRRLGFQEMGKQSIVKGHPNHLSTLMKREPAR